MGRAMKRDVSRLISRCGENGWKAAVVLGVVLSALPLSAQTNTAVSTNLPSWITRPLPLADALDIALQQNGSILKARNDLEATYGVVVQTRAIALPKAQITSQFQAIDENSIDTPSQSTFAFGTDKSWG